MSAARTAAWSIASAIALSYLLAMIAAEGGLPYGPAAIVGAFIGLLGGVWLSRQS